MGASAGKADLSTGGYILSWEKGATRTTGVYNTTSTKSVMLPNGQLMSVPVNQTHGGNTINDSCEIRVEFMPDNHAKGLAYQGDRMCAEWFPIPEVK